MQFLTKKKKKKVKGLKLWWQELPPQLPAYDP